MRIIYKYGIVIADTTRIQMPKGAAVLSIQMQGDNPCLWAEVDTDQPMVIRGFRIIYTGHNYDDVTYKDHVGSFQMHNGAIALHVFDLGED